MSSVNVTTKSKGQMVNQSLVLPRTKKIKETLKKIISTTQTKHKVNLESKKETIPTIDKPVRTVVKKT